MTNGKDAYILLSQNTQNPQGGLKMNIVETLKNSMPLMTAKQQHIAGFMVNNPSEMCYISLKDFSSQVGCTEATAIRFCQKLGYASFTDAKNAFRSIQAA